jgi:hypothetical protein
MIRKAVRVECMRLVEPAFKVRAKDHLHDEGGDNRHHAIDNGDVFHPRSGTYPRCKTSDWVNPALDKPVAIPG